MKSYTILLSAILSVVFLFPPIWGIAQAPQLLTYQAVIRQGDGELIREQTVGLRISIIKESIFGSSVYVETHSAQTNANGLLTLQIGDGTVVLGNFGEVDWSMGPYFIKTETDPEGGDNYTITATNQLLSVPYALYAQNAEQLVGPLNETDPHFQSSVASGITSQDTAQWNAGLTESDPTWNGDTNDTVSISRSGNIGIGISNPMAQIHTQEDIIVNELSIGKGNNGTPFNTAMGINALSQNTDGLSNTAIGYHSLQRNTTGSANTGIGLSSLQGNTTGYGNTAIGSNSLISNSSGDTNVAIGPLSMFLSDTSSYNIAIGAKSLYKTKGNFNTSVGVESLYNNDLGAWNTAMGHQALYSNEMGGRNIANGYQALYSNIDGYQNVGIGHQALYSNTEASSNIAIGLQTLYSNSDPSADLNIAIGSYALYSNISGFENVGIGYHALNKNTEGSGNVALGAYALQQNTIGMNNIGLGDGAMQWNTEGKYNIGIGLFSLRFNHTGESNIAIGNSALQENTEGSFNIAVGYEALLSNTLGASNLVIGNRAMNNNIAGGGNIGIGGSCLFELKGGDGNIAIGVRAGKGSPYSTNSIFIGNDTYTNKDSVVNSTSIGFNNRVTADNQVRIGNPLVTSIGGYVDWSVISDGRFKKAVASNVEGLTFITKLRPVTYQLDMNKIDNFYTVDQAKKAKEAFSSSSENGSYSEQANIRYSGFIAQEVEAAAQAANYDFSGLDAPDNEKDTYSLRYGSFTVPLVQAVQELNEIVDSQDRLLTNQQQRLKKLQRDYDKQSEKLHELSLQIQSMQKQLNQMNIGLEDD